MRVTLLPPASRTPACPGFGVFGDRKKSCFDRTWPEWGISGEVGVRGFSDGCGRVVAEGGGHRGWMMGWGFERVQMEWQTLPLGDRVGGCLLGLRSFGLGWMSADAASFERVQMGLAGGRICARTGCRAGGGLSADLRVERVQMGCGPGVRGLWKPGLLMSSFERVQMAAAPALEGGRLRHFVLGGGPVVSVGSQPCFQSNNTPEESAMPSLK